VVHRVRGITAALGVIRRTAAALLVALVVALAACGDDSDGGEQSSGNATDQRGGTGPAGSTAAAGSGATGADDPRTPDPGPNDEGAPEQTTPPEDRGKSTQGYGPKPVPRKKLIYEQSRYLCGQVGIEGLQREYGIESTDPRTLARAVSRRTSMRGMRAAVYSGCLAGLGSGN
jgi:hypothetical protein